MNALVFLLPILFYASIPCSAAGVPETADIPVPHLRHEPHPLPGESAQDVRAVAVDPADRVWAATAEGLFLMPQDRSGWRRFSPQHLSGPLYDLALDASGSLWVAAWNGLHQVRDATSRRVSGIDTPVRALAAHGELIMTGGPAGFHRVHNEAVESWNPGCTRYLHRIQAGPDNVLWFATAMGLFKYQADQGHYLTPDFDRLSIDIRDVAPGPDGQIWAASLGGLLMFEDDRLRQQFNSDHGLPSADVRSVIHAPDGSIWVGTGQGLARFDGEQWSVRQGRRWLLDNDVRRVVFDSTGAAWVATGKGVSRLIQTHLTLAAKAAHFDAILRARHVRPPGIVEKCRLRVPGDLTSWEPEDDDNDGGYTAVYLAMESYRYAATRDPEALAAANRAFATLEFLQTVTGTDGFIARTVIPADWKSMHDPNVPLTEIDWAEEWSRDPRNKRVPVRWRPSADGQWLWKGDTSSDEITAHMFGYYVFHELAADDSHRTRVRAQVTRIVDHLLENGFLLVDADGRHTRWGVWAPERLNHDPDWSMERGINSLEVLSFLKLAHYLSGDPKYETAYRRLIEDHHYDRNVLDAPILNPAWRTYIDTELLAFAYPALLTLEPDHALRRTYQRSFERWHASIRHDGNPFFEFLYAAHLNPDQANLDGARAFLRDVPLDLVRWTMDNSHREDLRLRRSPVMERLQTERLLPPSEICYTRTDQNPWHAVQGDGGRTESDGVFYLLPYWMGRHHGFIDPTDVSNR